MGDTPQEAGPHRLLLNRRGFSQPIQQVPPTLHPQIVGRFPRLQVMPSCTLTIDRCPPQEGAVSAEKPISLTSRLEAVGEAFDENVLFLYSDFCLIGQQFGMTTLSPKWHFPAAHGHADCQGSSHSEAGSTEPWP